MVPRQQHGDGADVIGEVRAVAAHVLGTILRLLHPAMPFVTEVLWAALHGLTTLARNDRLRPGRDTDRIQLLIAQFDDAGSRKP